MVPGALLATAAAGLVIGLGADYFKLIMLSTESGDVNVLSEITRAGVMGYVFVYAGASIAPTERRWVPVSLAGLYSVTFVALFTLVSRSSEYHFEYPLGLVVVLLMVAVLAAAGGAVASIRGD